MNDEEAFRGSFGDFDRFPTNLVYNNTYKHVLEAYVERLALQNDRLFSSEDKTSVELWEYADQSTGGLAVIRIGFTAKLNNRICLASPERPD